MLGDNNVPDNTPPRVDFAVRFEGALLASIANSVHKLSCRISLSQLKFANINKENRPIKMRMPA